MLLIGSITYAQIPLHLNQDLATILLKISERENEHESKVLKSKQMVIVEYLYKDVFNFYYLNDKNICELQVTRYALSNLNRVYKGLEDFVYVKDNTWVDLTINVKYILEIDRENDTFMVICAKFE
jgi:hypothetical protein